MVMLKASGLEDSYSSSKGLSHAHISEAVLSCVSVEGHERNVSSSVCLSLSSLFLVLASDTLSNVCYVRHLST